MSYLMVPRKMDPAEIRAYKKVGEAFATLIQHRGYLNHETNEAILEALNCLENMANGRHWRGSADAVRQFVPLILSADFEVRRKS